MIGTHLPKRLVSLHASVANNGIHEAMLKTMTHMQSASHIRWWNHDAKRCATRIRLGVTGRKIVVLFPFLVPALFNFLWLVFLHFWLFSTAFESGSSQPRAPAGLRFQCTFSDLNEPAIIHTGQLSEEIKINIRAVLSGNNVRFCSLTFHRYDNSKT